MSDREHKEELFGLRLVKDRVLTEAQLSTARDFQKAVGGSLGEVIVRLKLVDPGIMAPYLEEEGAQASPEPTRSGALAAAAARDERRSVSTMPADPADPAESRQSALSDAVSSGDRKVSGFSETSIVLEALIRLLVKKGVISKSDLKNEVLQMDTADLVRNGVIVGAD